MKKRIAIWSAAAGVSVLMISWIVVTYNLSKAPLKNFIPRLYVMGEVSTTATSIDELIQETQARADEFMNTSVNWNADTGTITASPAELGFQANMEQFKSHLDKMENSKITKLLLYLDEADLEVQASVDMEALKAAFIDSGIEQGMKEGAYFYKRGVQIDPSQDGYGIEYQDLANQLIYAWKKQTIAGTETLPMRKSPANITTELLETHKESVEELAATMLTIQDTDGTEWNLEMKNFVHWIIPAEERLWVEHTSFSTFLDEEIAADVEEQEQNVIITENEGKVLFEGTARYGRLINHESSRQSVEDMINKEERKPVVLTIDLIEPEVSVPESLAEKGITDLLGYGYSDFKGSPFNRVHNVNIGMDIFNGTLIAPGEEFSFTTLMGPIDAAHGWAPELVIKGDETIPEYGGGLCQVSSTMFRAALLTGMPITQRRNHSYAVSYYAYPDGYGLDATIYDPWPDFRFMNDTEGHLLIQGYTDGTDAYFVFYGTNDGRQVTMEKGNTYDYSSIDEPQITYTDELAPGEQKLDEYAHTGFKINWWRTIEYADGTTSERETYHSDYEARPEKILEGTPLEEREQATEDSQDAEPTPSE